MAGADCAGRGMQHDFEGNRRGLAAAAGIGAAGAAVGGTGADHVQDARPSRR